MRVLQIRREVEHQKVQEACKKETNSKRRLWLEIITLVLKGLQGNRIAQIFGIHPVTVSRAVARFNAEGLEGMYCQCQGGPSRVTAAMDQAIAQRVEQALQADPNHLELVRGHDLQQMLEKEYGITVHLTTIYYRLRRLGYTVLTPRPRHAKQDIQQMEIFKKRDASKHGKQSASVSS